MRLRKSLQRLIEKQLPLPGTVTSFTGAPRSSSNQEFFLLGHLARDSKGFACNTLQHRSKSKAKARNGHLSPDHEPGSFHPM